MKLIFISFLLFISNITVKSQANYGFQNGIIITTSQDTIRCLVPIASSFAKKIETKKDKDSKIQELGLDNIKYLITDYNTYEHISYNYKNEEIHKLMWWKIDGKLSLYLEVVSATAGNTHENGNLLITNLREPITTYVAKKDGQFYLIGEKKEFIPSILPLIQEYPELVKKVEAKKYRYDNIEQLVNEYNQLTSTK